MQLIGVFEIEIEILYIKMWKFIWIDTAQQSNLTFRKL